MNTIEKNKQLLLVTIKALEKVINYQRSDYTKKSYQMCKEEGSYPFIPISTSRSLNDFIMLRNILYGDISNIRSSKIHNIRKIWEDNISDNKNRMFIDAGCGIGNVMLLARATDLCYDIHGIEYFHDTYQKALNWLGIEKGGKYEHYEIFKENILDFDKYSAYDIIYYYRPFENMKLQSEFERIVEDNMKVGAVLIPRLKKRIKEIQRDSRFISIFEFGRGIEPIYIKIKN